MKQLIIFLLVIILLLIGYSQYKQYKRFTPPEYEYVAHDNIDLNYYSKSFLLNYYKAIEDVNGYVITQWSANEIDVRNPSDDANYITSAVSKYNDKLGLVKYYEGQLIKSKSLKEQGLTNADIKSLEDKGITMLQLTEETNKRNRLKLFKDLFEDANASNGLRLGSSNAFIYELQKLLVNKGYNLPVDGVYKNITSDAVKLFEEKNGLFPDGKLDALTLDVLLK